MGDGSVVPFAGGIFREKLSAPDTGSAYDAVAEAMEG
jgi:hypothetical protein